MSKIKLPFSPSSSPSSFSAKNRRVLLSQAQHSLFDLLIVGGGINGAGIAREAAGRGLKVALVNHQDFAFGTSSRSSKLIHGGLRYLEHGYFSLVRESLKERQILLEIAPHLVKPLPFILPLYRSSRISPLKMSAGLWFYDLFSLFQSPSRHGYWSGKKTQQKLPFLRKEGLRCAFTYWDAAMEDALLVLENLRSATRLGAICLNYVKAERVLGLENPEGFQELSLECKDEVEGSTSTFQLRARHIISSVGPWTDKMGKSWFPSHWKPQLHLSKGVHLWIPPSKLPLSSALVLHDEAQRRIAFVIPQEHGGILVGTTDTEYTDMDTGTGTEDRENPDPVCAHKEDVDYLLSLLKNYFPHTSWSYKDVISSYAGLRPLLKETGKEKTLSVGKTSREHRIWQGHPQLTFVAGGKYTTYRKVAQEVVDFCLSSFTRRERASFQPSQSKSPLHPQCSLENLQRAREKKEEWFQQYPQYRPSDLSAFVERHAMETEELLKKYAHHCQNLWQVEAYYAMEEGMCLHLKDFYQRYSALMACPANQPQHSSPHPNTASSSHSSGSPAFSRPPHSHSSSPPSSPPSQEEEIAQCFQKHLQWPEEQKREEIHFLHKFLKSRAFFADF